MLNYHTACVYYRVMECMIPALTSLVHQRLQYAAWRARQCSSLSHNFIVEHFDGNCHVTPHFRCLQLLCKLLMLQLLLLIYFLPIPCVAFLFSSVVPHKNVPFYFPPHPFFVFFIFSSDYSYLEIRHVQTFHFLLTFFFSAYPHDLLSSTFLSSVFHFITSWKGIV